MAVIFFDFDSTVVTKETLDDAILRAIKDHPEREKVFSEIEAITRLGMEGKLDFLESVKRRLAIATVSRRHLEETGTSLLGKITHGMHEIFDWLRGKKHEIFIVSGGFKECIDPVAKKLGIAEKKIHSNRFIYDSKGDIAGIDETSPLWTNEGKTPVLKLVRQVYPDEKFIIIGDGMNDFRAYEAGAAEHFIGFGANVVRESVKSRAPYFVHSAQELVPILDKLL